MKHIARKDLATAIRMVMAHHLGPANAIPMTQLFSTVTGETVHPGKRYDQTRVLRSVIDQLRAEQYPICYCDAGYYMPRTWEELEPCIAMLEGRAMASFRTASNLRRCSVRDLLRHYQLTLPMEDSNHEEITTEKTGD